MIYFVRAAVRFRAHDLRYVDTAAGGERLNRERLVEAKPAVEKAT